MEIELPPDTQPSAFRSPMRTQPLPSATVAPAMITVSKPSCDVPPDSPTLSDRLVALRQAALKSVFKARVVEPSSRADAEVAATTSTATTASAAVANASQTVETSAAATNGQDREAPTDAMEIATDETEPEESVSGPGMTRAQLLCGATIVRANEGVHCATMPLVAALMTVLRPQRLRDVTVPQDAEEITIGAFSYELQQVVLLQRN